MIVPLFRKLEQQNQLLRSTKVSVSSLLRKDQTSAFTWSCCNALGKKYQKGLTARDALVNKDN